MSQPGILSRVISVLEGAGIEYMVTGSIVSSSQGQPRATHDIDLVVKLLPSAVPTLLQAFPPPEYYLDELSVREAIRRRDMFNLMEVDTGDKVDFWLLTDEAYDRERFSRRVPWDLAGIPAKVSRPEDTILQKLRWSELSGGSQRQFNDAKAVLELQTGDLDLAYIESWSKALGLQGIWARLQRESRPIR